MKKEFDELDEQKENAIEEFLENFTSDKVQAFSDIKADHNAKIKESIKSGSRMYLKTQTLTSML